jgi:glutamate formiminotransferase / formiminotetrahydrofolate cyclodeaminase
MTALIECVPNFSEGRDPAIIAQITAAIESVEGVRLLNVDPGHATNRTVVTFVGEPEPVIEAAFRAIRTAGEVIDMRQHRGEHPRIGATDVCPLVPVSGISMEEVAGYARRLGERVGNELQLPVYLYEEAQPDKSRSNLAAIRSGEYEGLARKIARAEWKPDFGPATFDARRGATVIGARNFLVAYNVDLNTTSTRRANAIAFDVREAGRTVKDAEGNAVLDERGQPVTQPGTLQAVKAIGWFIPEYGIAQVSMNLTNIDVTPVHLAFEAVCRAADARGVRVTGSELVGLIPLRCLLEAGRYFLHKQRRSTGVSETQLVMIAIHSLGLNDVTPFKPEERVIEYLLRDATRSRLASMPLAEFVDETASESPAPGGGSVAAAVGALGAALGTMVANLSSHKRGWDARWQEFSDWADRGQQSVRRLVALVDDDTRAFEAVMAAFGLPKATDDEQAARRDAIQTATLGAAEVPLGVMEAALESMDLILAMAKDGQPSSVSDAGVGALCARAAVRGAWLNVRINVKQLRDRAAAQNLLDRGAALVDRAEAREREILAAVDSRM